MTDFKVGGKVKIINTSIFANYVKIGDIAEVRKVDWSGITLYHPDWYGTQTQVVTMSNPCEWIIPITISESITGISEDQATQVSLEEENVSETNTESLKGIENTYRIQAVVNVEVGVTIRDLTHYLSRDEAYKLYQDLKVIFEEKLI